MATTKHKNGRTYRYSFWHNGVRFSGPTGATTKRDADRAEARVIAQVEAGTKLDTPRSEMMLREATGRFWVEKAQFEKSSATTFTQLRHLTEGLGPNTLISRITANELTAYQSAQREARRVCDRTISAEVPELLSRVFRRAGLWGAAVPSVDWSALRMRRAAPRVRSLTQVEEQRLFTGLRRDYHRIIRFGLETGLRRSALFVQHDWVDWGAGVLRYPKKSKYTNDTGLLPLTRRMQAILRRETRLGKHPTHVFTYVATKTRDGRVAGGRYPITADSLRDVMRRAVRAAEIKNWRLIHDLRHTAATRTLKRSKNLAAIQGMLGHSEIGQTARYAHAMMDDVLEAMES